MGLLIIVWSALIAVSLIWNILQEKQETQEAASSLARSAIIKDIFYRRWNAQHGGVFVFVNERIQPNPYLSMVEKRDLITTDGDSLTMINPAFMTRLVHELQSQEEGIQGHITSLNPIRPANEADAWETIALQAFEEGENEFSSLESMDDQEFLRLMRPLLVEESCLKCHAQQGYQVGEVRGGISVSVPMATFRETMHQQLTWIISGHLVLWLFGVLGLVGVFRLLERQTQQRRDAERRMYHAAKMADLGTMAAGVAHELNSPLQVVTGVSASLHRRLERGEAVAAEELIHALETIRSNGWRSAGIVQSLLRYSELRVEEMELHDLSSLLEDALKMAENQFGAWEDRNITVVQDLEPAELPILCNPDQIVQALVSLLSNAHDAMHEGGRLFIRTRLETASKKITLSIQDDGEGIPEENKEHIFTPFFTTKDIGAGSGLGLSLVQSILQSHHAAISVDSRQGEGTTVILGFQSESSPISPGQTQKPDPGGRYDNHISTSEGLN